MPNAITSTGLTTLTQQELVDQFTAAFEAIYGADINLDSDSPDGQMMMIIIQAYLDVLDLLTQIYTSMDPDSAFGRVLDARVAYNGIQRQAGTYTTTDVTIVTSQALTLFGLDQSEEDPYTVADNAGNQWQLVTTQHPAGAGTYVYSFRAALPGAVLTTLNTITVPVSIVLGVSSINNPTTYTTLGLNEETDAALKVRRQQSVSLSSQGYLSGLLAALLNVSGVTAAFVYENTSGTTDSNGVPGHSIWAIVNGGADLDVANAIYRKRNAGCGMKGTETYAVTQADGTSFVVRWDFVTTQPLYIQFTATSLNGVDLPDATALAAGIARAFAPGVAAKVNINELSTIVQEIDPNTLVTLSGFSTAALGPFTNTLAPTQKNYQFTIDPANIAIMVTPL